MLAELPPRPSLPYVYAEQGSPADLRDFQVMLHRPMTASPSGMRYSSAPNICDSGAMMHTVDGVARQRPVTALPSLRFCRDGALDVVSVSGKGVEMCPRPVTASGSQRRISVSKLENGTATAAERSSYASIDRRDSGTVNSTSSTPTQRIKPPTARVLISIADIFGTEDVSDIDVSDWQSASVSPFSHYATYNYLTDPNSTQQDKEDERKISERRRRKREKLLRERAKRKLEQEKRNRCRKDVCPSGEEEDIILPLRPGEKVEVESQTAAEEDAKVPTTGTPVGSGGLESVQPTTYKIQPMPLNQSPSTGDAKNLESASAQSATSTTPPSLKQQRRQVERTAAYFAESTRKRRHPQTTIPNVATLRKKLLTSSKSIAQHTKKQASSDKPPKPLTEAAGTSSPLMSVIVGKRYSSALRSNAQFTTSPATSNKPLRWESAHAISCSSEDKIPAVRGELPKHASSLPFLTPTRTQQNMRHSKLSKANAHSPSPTDESDTNLPSWLPTQSASTKEGRSATLDRYIAALGTTIASVAPPKEKKSATVKLSPKEDLVENLVQTRSFRNSVQKAGATVAYSRSQIVGV
ncbi:hypothetical protein HDU85_002231 [Gaertneriomyces sp. JEL0708]|nr:hypothetical protein HDU85_002231 [Gaertneriomyces sp. JEL0708]